MELLFSIRYMEIVHTLFLNDFAKHSVRWIRWFPSWWKNINEDTSDFVFIPLLSFLNSVRVRKNNVCLFFLYCRITDVCVHMLVLSKPSCFSGAQFIATFFVLNNKGHSTKTYDSALMRSIDDSFTFDTIFLSIYLVWIEKI